MDVRQGYSNNYLFSYRFPSKLRAFLIGTLLIVLGMGTYGCESSQENSADTVFSSFQPPLILVIKNQADEFSEEVSNQVLSTLDYTKIPFITLDLGIISQEFSIPNSVRSIVFTAETVDYFTEENISQLVEFVALGNSIVFVGPPVSDKFSFLQGVKPDSDFTVDSTSNGIKVSENVFPGMKGKSYDLNAMPPHLGITADQFTSDVTILATTVSDQNTPVILSNKIGLGEVITINSYKTAEKIYRGFLFSSILKGLPGIPYQVANVSTIFLDDFPAPLYNEKLPPIDQEYDVTHAQFVNNIWWPDMKAFADSFNISYSAMTAFNYNANVVPPFDFQEWRQGSIVYNQNVVEGSIFLAKDIRDTRHELAFHGYNHFSLQLEDWDNMNFMISSLQAARKRWRIDNMGDLPTNYVPPTNQIDSVGIQAIIRGMPSIKYISSLYFGDIEDGGGREFGPDPYAPSELFNYPRISSGLSMNENSLFDQHGMQLLTGVWNHFIHPDDVFQVTQREEDEFTSRNPLGLGWKSHPVYRYGLYHLFRQRVLYTIQHYPNTRFVTATKGSELSEYWRQRLSTYEINSSYIKVTTSNRTNVNELAEEVTKDWFMYVTSDQVSETESVLELQDLEYSRSELWYGYLYQFNAASNAVFAPNFDKSIENDPQVVENLVRDELADYNQYNIFVSNITLEEWQDTRLRDAIQAWRMNPDNITNQDSLIAISVEYGQVSRALIILENRLLKNKNWSQDDGSQLITYYGWESMQSRAELFLEELWEVYKSDRVIALKDKAVVELGLFGEDFERRWQLRELQLHPGDYERILAYTKSIEGQETWPEMKQNLRQLLEMRPYTDSLYAFTVQRSIFYASADSTMSLVEEFPVNAYPQLSPVASDLALMYGFVAEDYEKALFWANNSPEFDESLELFWLGLLNYDDLYLAQAKDMISDNPRNDSLRSNVGTNLFYRGFTEESYEILYPLFEISRESDLAADTLMRNEIGYLPYSAKKEFYNRYPEFFNDDQEEQLQRDFRYAEGVKATLSGEFRDDNFNNTFGRGGVSVEIGNRQKNTHTFRSEYLVFSDEGLQTSATLNYQGVGYQFTHRSDDQQFEFRAGPTLLFGEGDYIPEALISVGFSVDSSYTSVQLTGGAELTSTSLQNDYYQAQVQLYRQDYWADGNLLTSISTNGKYYTNSVFQYGAQGRVYLDIMESKWRLRPTAELSYSDATENYASGIPFYTPDQYFSQGIGLDLQFRNPDTFEYKTQLTGEVMGKKERREGAFLTARVELQHKFRNFWEFSLGSEISTSQVYRSNRIFFTISHYFPKKLIPRN
jgi:hypothetical protein